MPVSVHHPIMHRVHVTVSAVVSLILAAVRASPTDQYLQDPVVGQLTDVGNVYGDDLILDEGLLAGTPLDALAYRDETFADPGRTTVRKATDLEVIGRPSDLYLGGLEKCSDADYAQATISSRQVSAIFVVTRRSYTATGRVVFVRSNGTEPGVLFNLKANTLLVGVFNATGGVGWLTTLAVPWVDGDPYFVLFSIDSLTGALYVGVYNQVGVQMARVSVGASAIRVHDIRTHHYIGRGETAGAPLDNATINSMCVIDGAAVGETTLKSIMTAMIAGGKPGDFGFPNWIGLSGGAHQASQPTRLVYAGGAGAAVEVQKVPA